MQSDIVRDISVCAVCKLENDGVLKGGSRLDPLADLGIKQNNVNFFVPKVL